MKYRNIRELLKDVGKRTPPKVILPEWTPPIMQEFIDKYVAIRSRGCNEK